MTYFDVHIQSFAAYKMKPKHLVNDLINGVGYSYADY